jgi:hypothetical protein
VVEDEIRSSLLTSLGASVLLVVEEKLRRVVRSAVIYMARAR